MNGKSDDRFYDDKKKIQHDADDECPVDILQVHRMVVVTESMAVVMVVGMRMGVIVGVCHGVRFYR